MAHFPGEVSLAADRSRLRILHNANNFSPHYGI
jgi:hypothetical protein